MPSLSSTESPLVAPAVDSTTAKFHFTVTAIISAQNMLPLVNNVPSSDVINDKRTCANPVHQEVERVKITRGQSRFILKERLQRQRVAHPNDSVDPTEDLEDVEEVEEEFLVNNSGRVVLEA
jgi:hypothetical protein